MTIEELRSYKQIRTPDYAALANYVNRAKGEKRTMAQFAEDTGIGASTLSRIANMKIQKPLSIEVLITIYEKRADPDATYLLDALARSNGLASPSYVERVNTQHRNFSRRNDELNRANMMKNSILAGVLAAGMPIKKVFDGRVASSVDLDNAVPHALLGRACDFFMALGENQSPISMWKVYLYPNQPEEQDQTRIDRDVRMDLHWLMQRISPMFLRDAWQPESLAGTKTSFAFLDERLFDAFVETMRCAKIHNEMTVLLLDPSNSYKVLKEVWIPGEYKKLTEISIFELPAPIDDDEFEDYSTYEPENMEDNE